VVDLTQTQIGRYKVLKTLGEGAMAQVYLAELSTLGGFRRKVALKIVHPEFARDKKFLQLMGREAMIGSRLQHPNIVETLEFNEADGRTFLALEYVEGQTLEQLLDRIRNEGRDGLPVDFCLELILPVLEGLAYAHTLPGNQGEPMGIIHRDLKPANIMVSRHGVVKIMDFGIAKARGTSSNLTTVGQVRGTPLYMSPEQVTGQELDGRSDQFSAATVLFELLTGGRAFGGGNLIDIMQKVARSDAGTGLQQMADLHPRLEEILGRMWSVEPEDRFADCTQAANALENLLLELRHQASAQEQPEATSEKKIPSKPRSRKKKRPQKKGGILALMGLIRSPTRKTRKKSGAAQRRRKRKRQRAAQASQDTPATAAPPATSNTVEEEAHTVEETGPQATDSSSQPLGFSPQDGPDEDAADGDAVGRTISLIFMEEIFDEADLSEVLSGSTLSVTDEVQTGDPPPEDTSRTLDAITTQKGTPVVTEPMEVLDERAHQLNPNHDEAEVLQPQEETPAREEPPLDDFFFGDFDDSE